MVKVQPQRRGRWAVNLRSNVVALALSRRSKAASRASIALVGGDRDRGNQPPAGASLMIVVRLVSATRRPTVH